ncbi:MAG: DUF6242 domain-containing protein [Dysgonamonadaceae bacterium]|nr:DUF6242 domain-containing protein [Dysgonamonadaceae bacterium]MDD4727803.1 DUF6242 domain-containing protein [Dysgonamonadaceae bacterium]
MIYNWFYYCFAFIAAAFILSSCLNSDEVDYEYSADAQITSLTISSPKDSLRILPKVVFSIDQVSSAPIIFNKDSLPYLFEVSSVIMNISTNSASGIKLYLANDSSYIWNTTDSVMINELKHIEIYAQDGKTKKTYTFKLNTHQQDPDTIFWQTVTENYIANPTDQVTIANKNRFFAFYKSGGSTKLSTSDLADGSNWTSQTLSGLPQNVILNTIQQYEYEGIETWYALDSNYRVYHSSNGTDWQLRTTTLPTISIFGKLPSFTNDSILAIVKDGSTYKFAKTKDFSSLRLLNNVPAGFPITDYTYTSINDTLNYTAKYLIVTGGKSFESSLNNKSVWILQEKGNTISSTSKILNFNVTGSSLFQYDKKIYLMTPENNKNVFYTSPNYGVFWEKAGNKQSLPSNFTTRVNQSVSVDDDNFIWIFGGESANQTQLVDVWKGRINKLFVK